MALVDMPIGRAYGLPLKVSISTAEVRWSDSLKPGSRRVRGPRSLSSPMPTYWPRTSWRTPTTSIGSPAVTRVISFSRIGFKLPPPEICCTVTLGYCS